MADEETKDLLKRLHLEDLTDIFKKNNITQSVLNILDRPMIDDLIQEIGPRAIFINYWKMNICTKKQNPPDKNRSVSDSNPGVLDTSNMCQKYTLRSIEQILKGTNDGKRILIAFETHKELTLSSRNKMCNLILDEIEDTNMKIDNDLASFVADKIVEFFTGEIKSTYFNAPVKKSASSKKKSEPATGKVLSMWRNRQTKLKNFQKNLKKEESERNTRTSLEILSSTSQNSNGVENSEEVKQAIEWLKDNMEPWTYVVNNWPTTFCLRKKELSSLEDRNLLQIFEKWNHFKHPNGYQLINIDFDCTNLSKVILNYHVWMQFIKTVRMLTRINKKDNTASEYLETLSCDMDNHTENELVATSLMLLAHLIPPVNMKKTGKRSAYKPSIASAKRTMIQNAMTPGDVSKIKQDVRNLAASNKFPVQPYIIIVGKLKEIIEVYVCLDETLYKVNTVLEGVDICFKAFFVFELKYPYDSQHLWLLIQKSIYGIKTEFDPVFPFMEHLISKVTETLQVKDKSNSKDQTSEIIESERDSDIVETSDIAIESSSVSDSSNCSALEKKKNHKAKNLMRSKKNNSQRSSESD